MPLHVPATAGASTPATGSHAPSGAYFGGFGSTTAVTLGGLAGSSAFARIYIPRAMTVDRIGVEITTAIAASTTRLAIYSNVNDVATALILDAGTVDSSTTGFKEITISQALSQGWVFLGVSASINTVGIRSFKGGGGHGFHSTAATYSQYIIPGFLSTTWTGAGAAPAGPITAASGGEDSPRLILRAA